MNLSLLFSLIAIALHFLKLSHVKLALTVSVRLVGSAHAWTRQHYVGCLLTMVAVESTWILLKMILR